MDHGGGARRKQNDYTDGPWIRWRTKSLPARAIRFITTYLRPPKGYGYGQPLKLAPFQKQWIEQILSEGVSSAVMSCPRGQGKSTLLAALAVWNLFDKSDSGAPQVPIIATRTQQAIRSVYSVAVSMVKAEPELADRSLIYTAIGKERIFVEQTGGECFPMANGIDGLQGLDPSLAIVDEIGFQSQEVWDSVVLASGKRPRSLVVGIGTPGFDRNNALWHLRHRWQESGGGLLEGFHYTEHAADDGCNVDDQEQWRKANPALVQGYQNISALKTALRMTPEAHFRIFHLGQWTDGTDGWLGTNGGRIWDALTDEYTLVDGARTWVGLDIGIKHDSTAVVVGQRRLDGRLHVICRIWLPQKEDAIDLTAIMQYLREIDGRYDVEAIAYDPRLFEIPARTLQDEGLPMVEVPQSLDRMTPAFGSLYQAIKSGEISHNKDIAFTTQILNAVPRFNERGFTLAKRNSRGKIDACYALVMCHDRAQRTAPPRPQLAVV